MRVLTAALPYLLLMINAAAVAAPSVDKMEGAVDSSYDSGLTGTLALGYTSARGNTQTSSLDTRAAMTYGAGQWYHAFSAEKIRSSEDSKETASTTTADAQSDFLFTPHNYVFAHLGYNRDRFGGITRRTSEAVGYGFRLLGTPTTIWSVQIGVGARQENVRGIGKRQSAIAQIASSYSWQMSANSRLSEDVVIERGKNNIRSESATRLTLKIIKNLSLVAAYTIKHNSQVPVNTYNTDAYTSVSVEYAF